MQSSMQGNHDMLKAYIVLLLDVCQDIFHAVYMHMGYIFPTHLTPQNMKRKSCSDIT